MNRFIAVLAAGILSFSTAPAFANGWSLVDGSKIAFGSVKKDLIGESHHFTSLSGSVSTEGAAMVEIDVTSLETWIDIRNERMQKHVFDSSKFPKAVISATLDMDEFAQMKPGQMATTDTEAKLTFLGQELEVDAELFVVALADDKVMVTTDEMVMLATEDLGINTGIDTLMKLADLPSITRVTPVTLRLIFEKQ